MSKKRYPFTLDELETHLLGLAVNQMIISEEAKVAFLGEEARNFHPERLRNFLDKIVKFGEDHEFIPSDGMENNLDLVKRVKEELLTPPVTMQMVKH